MTAFITGFTVSITLILAIGAQNAFVLRQGILRQHVGAIVAFCAISDALLILAGVYGAGRFIAAIPSLENILLWIGIAFLTLYALTRFYAAFKGNHVMQAEGGAAQSLRSALLTCAGFTFLNPHVYLDTFVLMGTISLPFTGTSKLVFAIGGAFASLVFFTSLGYGARLLTPIFKNQNAWRILDFLIAILMVALVFFLWTSIK